jgi:hypothetical protein
MKTSETFQTDESTHFKKPEQYAVIHRHRFEKFIGQHKSGGRSIPSI